jgi:hypothetical protein
MSGMTEPSNNRTREVRARCIPNFGRQSDVSSNLGGANPPPPLIGNLERNTSSFLKSSQYWLKNTYGWTEWIQCKYQKFNEQMSVVVPEICTNKIKRKPKESSLYKTELPSSYFFLCVLFFVICIALYTYIGSVISIYILLLTCWRPLFKSACQLDSFHKQ